MLPTGPKTVSHIHGTIPASTGRDWTTLNAMVRAASQHLFLVCRFIVVLDLVRRIRAEHSRCSPLKTDRTVSFPLSTAHDLVPDLRRADENLPVTI